MPSTSSKAARPYSRIGLLAVTVGAAVVAVAIWAAVGNHGRHTPTAQAGVIHSTPRPALTLSGTPAAAGAAASPTASTASILPPASAASAAPMVATAPATPATTAAAPPATASSRQVTYTVQPGDNLTVISAWFHAHGYQPVYDWNKTVIGQDPNLIKPGQVLVVAVQ